MVGNLIIRKCLTVGIILLFIVMAFSPVINARNNTIESKSFSIPEKENTVSITVLEFKADGTIEKTIVKMAQEQKRRFSSELKGIKEMDARLSIYKKYGLIPQDITLETLQDGLERNAQRLELTQQKLKHIATIDSYKLSGHGEHINQKLKRDTLINAFCNIYCEFALPILLPLGLSFFTVYILHKNGYKFKIFDLSDRIITIASYACATNGVLPDFEVVQYLSYTKIIGFVGYAWYDISYFWSDVIFFGSALYIRTSGDVY